MIPDGTESNYMNENRYDFLYIVI